MTADVHLLKEKLGALRTELIDLAFVLERKGRLDAADIAIATSGRVGDLCDELEASVPAQTK